MSITSVFNFCPLLIYLSTFSTIDLFIFLRSPQLHFTPHFLHHESSLCQDYVPFVLCYVFAVCPCPLDFVVSDNSVVACLYPLASVVSDTSVVDCLGPFDAAASNHAVAACFCQFECFYHSYLVAVFSFSVLITKSATFSTTTVNVGSATTFTPKSAALQILINVSILPGNTLHTTTFCLSIIL